MKAIGAVAALAFIGFYVATLAMLAWKGYEYIRWGKVKSHPTWQCQRSSERGATSLELGACLTALLVLTLLVFQPVGSLLKQRSEIALDVSAQPHSLALLSQASQASYQNEDGVDRDYLINRFIPAWRFYFGALVLCFGALLINYRGDRRWGWRCGAVLWIVGLFVLCGGWL